MRFAALRSRDFRLLLAGQAVSLTGTQMQQVAVVWQLYLLTNSPLSLGLLGAFRVAPIVVFALGGGVAADAFDRKKLLLVSQTGMALASLGLLVATQTQMVSPAIIYALAALAGAASAFDPPSRQALLPQLVSIEVLPNALSTYNAVHEVASIAGPALGGALLAWKGVAPIYLIDVVSYLAVIFAILAMQHEAPPTPGLAGLSAHALLEGLRFLRRTPLILSTMLLDFVATFLAGSLLLLPIFADQLLHVGPRGLGIMYAAQPAGAVVAAGLLSWLPVVRRQGRVLLVAVAVYGGAIAAFGVSRWFPLSLCMLALSGAADAVSVVMRQTLRQILTPDALRGRMTSVNMIFFMGGPQLGEVEAGVVARLAGVRFSVWSGGLLCVAGALAAAVFVPSLRKYEHT
ncbi:MAG TPA: MFS transporter [Myxococcales bacterium]|nr:MFS transporter [Myxococcales bacterium]